MEENGHEPKQRVREGKACSIYVGLKMPYPRGLLTVKESSGKMKCMVGNVDRKMSNMNGNNVETT